MNWKTYVEKQNAKTYVLPEGWSSKEEVAEQLGCSPDSVRDRLKPGIASGEIEAQQFKVWNEERKQIVMVMAYRHRGSVEAHQKLKPWTPEEEKKALEMKKQGKTWGEIGKALGRTGEAIRKRLQ
jgi:predicted transcriptional regulator